MSSAQLRVSRISALAVAAGTLVLACGTTGGSGPVPTGSAAMNSHNSQDVTFTYQVMGLSQQVDTVSNIMIAKTDSTTAASSLEGLLGTVRERIALCRSWLNDWNAAGRSESPAPGLLTSEQIDQLTIAAGPELAAYVRSVVDSQVEATRAVANTELTAGKNEAAKQLALELPARIQAELAVIVSAAGNQ